MPGHRPDVAARLARRAKQRPFGPGPYIRGARIISDGASLLTPARLPSVYPFLPAVHQLEALDLDQPVTLLVGENGSGKSTLIEALAIKAGFAARGGALADDLRRQFERKAEESDKVLSNRLELLYGRHRPRTGFFLRAESFFDVATVVDEKGLVETYGDGTSLHQQSHGESFLALARSRFGPDGLYILDEPEAALSVTSQLAFIGLMSECADAGAQFIVATHSPILLSHPGATIYEISERGVAPTQARDTDPVRLTRAFLDNPAAFLRHLEEA